MPFRTFSALSSRTTHRSPLSRSVRAREREDEAVEDAAAERHAERPRDHGRRRPREPDLQETAERDPPEDVAEPRERELEPDGEEEEDDANLREHLDGVDGRREGEPVRAEERAGREEAGDRRQLQSCERQRHRDRERSDDGELVQQRNLRHRRSSSEPSTTRGVIR